METFLKFHNIMLLLRLNRTMQYGNPSGEPKLSGVCGRFKSYYVVWKLGVPSPMMYSIFCLNRTMQYGNFGSLIEVEYHLVCLNRTMQYGNIFSAAVESDILLGLNRTMQYGNSNCLFTVAPVFTRFKSYYVVWKLH